MKQFYSSLAGTGLYILVNLLAELI